jgi:hypothetical protein
MKPIQFILIPLFAFLMIVLGRKLKSHPVLRALVVLLLLAGMIFTAFDESSTIIANALGIGRGVDLVMYLSLLGLGVGCLLLYLRTLRLERMLIELVRQEAIEGDFRRERREERPERRETEAQIQRAEKISLLSS